MHFQMSQASLLWSDALHFFIDFNEVTAICKTCLLTDIVQTAVGKEQHVICLADLDELDIFLAGFAIQQLEIFSKVGIAHAALLRKILDPKWFIGVLINVFRDIVQ